MHEERRMLDADDGQIGIHIVRPDGDGPFPVVLSFHHGPGFDDGAAAAVAELAKEGFCVVSPDRYRRHGAWLTFDVGELMSAGPESEAFQNFIGIAEGTTEEMVSADVAVILAALADDPAMDTSVIGGLGYCVGARTIIGLMVDNPDLMVAGVGLHPSFCVTPEDDSPHHSVAKITGRLHMAIGTADHMSSVELNQPLIEAVNGLDDRGSVALIDGADHGFAVPGPTYSDGAVDCYKTAADIFAKALPGASS